MEVTERKRVGRCGAIAMYAGLHRARIWQHFMHKALSYGVDKIFNQMEDLFMPKWMIYHFLHVRTNLSHTDMQICLN